jgi:aryl-alcohol dehydrogenase-like predicted oxidoreductase
MTHLGNSDLDVFPLSLGGNTFGWTSDAAESEAVLDAFTARGGNFIDTADVYSNWKPGNTGGESETILGDWMRERGNRASIVLATKVGKLAPLTGLSAATIAAAAEASLQRLGTDYIDLYYAHADDSQTPIAESVAAFQRLVAAGTVRQIGLSNYSGARIREWMSEADKQGALRPVALQPHYNLVFRHDFETDLLPAVLEFDLAVVPYYGLASGFLTGKYRAEADLTGTRSGSVGGYLNPAGLGVLAVLDQIAAAHDVAVASVALAWLRSRPGVVAPIASARVPEQLPALMEGARLVLGADEIALLDTASAAFAASAPAGS